MPVFRECSVFSVVNSGFFPGIAVMYAGTQFFTTGRGPKSLQKILRFFSRSSAEAGMAIELTPWGGCGTLEVVGRAAPVGLAI